MADAEPFRILVLCVGNLCRSPMAESLLRRRLALAGERYAVASAGVGARPGRPMDPAAAAQLASLGGSAEGFSSRRLSAAEMERADLVLAATQAVRSRALAEAPRALRRSFTVLELAAVVPLLEQRLGHDVASAEQLVAAAARERARVAGAELDVPDPIGGSPDLHAAVAAQLDAATRVIADALLRVAAPAR